MSSDVQEATRTVTPRYGFNFSHELVLALLNTPHIMGNLLGRDLLEPQHSDWCKWVWDQTPGTHTGLQAHRGSYKTTGITEVGCVRWWIMHPQDRIALIRKTFTDASRSLAVVRQMMETEFVRGLYYTMHGEFPEFTEKKADSLTFSFKRTMTKEGSLGAYGINNLPTGLHVDKALCDDIVTDDDRYSDAEREKTVRSCRELLSSIIDRGKTCMFVGTPWHERDAWSLVIEAACPNGVKKFDRDATGIISDAEFAKICSLNTPAQIACNYFLKHVAADDLLFHRKAREQRWMSMGITPVTAHLDAKFDGNATTALTICQEMVEIAPNGSPWLQMTGWATDQHVELVIKEIVDRCIGKKVRHFFNENNPDKGLIYRSIMQEFKRRGYSINTAKKPEIYNYTEHQNKGVKIQSHLLRHWQNITWDIDTDSKYMNQIMDYQEGSRLVDAPDSAASLLRCFYDGTVSKNMGLSFFLPK